MKKKERRPKETGSQWLNGMCEVLKGGVLAGVITILALLVCAVLVSAVLVWGPPWRRAWAWALCCFCCC